MRAGGHRGLLKKNNFDLLRLVFAGSVCLVHIAELSGLKGLSWISGVFSASVAVKGFFVISGFLIFMSCEHASGIASYMGRRIRRIYPAYFTAIMLFGIGLVFVSSLPMKDYFSGQWLRYVLANLSFMNFLQPDLPGVFETHGYTAVNGALWTLKVEVMFYLSVPILVYLIRRFGDLPVLAVFYFASVAFAAWMSIMAERTGSGLYVQLARQLPAQLSYFVAGAFFYYRMAFFEKHAGWFLVPSLAALAANRLYPLPLFEPFALATAVVFVGLFLYVGNAGKYGDFSYGVYILHFPIIQLLVHIGLQKSSPSLFLPVAVSLTLASAIAMWHLVEKRFLLRSSHYVTAAAKGA